MNKQFPVIAALAAFTGSVYADTGTANTDPPIPIPTLSHVLDASGISLSGYMDVAYNKMNTTGLFINAPAGPLSGGVAGNSRIFDTPGAVRTKDFSGFNLHQAAVIISKIPKEGWGGYVNVTAGQDAATIASTGLGANTSVHTADLTQGYAAYTSGNLTVIGGKFATLAGAEVITSPSNKNYSRAWMFGWGPYTHTGVRATYVVNDKVTVIAGVNNGFDQVVATTGTRTSEVSLVLTPASLASLALTNYHGKEVTNAGLAGTRNYTDAILTLNASDKLNFVADYAYAKQDNAALPTGATGQAKWKALAVYANYQFSDAWRVSYRHENFDDPDGYRSNLTTGLGITGTPIGQKLKANTLTVGYAPTKNVELRAEGRYDWSSQAVFLQGNGTGRSNQTSYAVEAVYQF